MQSRLLEGLQGLERHSFMSPSHLSPTKPGGQLQRYPPTLSTQVPLFRHLGGALRILRGGAQSSSLISQRTPLRGHDYYILYCTFIFFYSHILYISVFRNMKGVSVVYVLTYPVCQEGKSRCNVPPNQCKCLHSGMDETDTH